MRRSIRALATSASAGSAAPRTNGASCAGAFARKPPTSTTGSSSSLVRQARQGTGHASSIIADHSNAQRPCARARYFGTETSGFRSAEHMNESTRRNPSRSRRHRPRPTPRPVTTAEQSRMQSLSSSLLCLDTNPPGSLTPPLTRTVHETIFWNLHLKSYEGTAAADNLIRRLVLERTDGWNSGCIIAGRAFEAVLDSWRIMSSPSPQKSSIHAVPAEERADSLLDYFIQSSMQDGVKDRNLVPSSKSYNMAIDAYARAARPDDARRIYDSHPHPDVVAFNGILKSLSVAIGVQKEKQKLADDALKLLQEREEIFDNGDYGADINSKAFGLNDVSYGTVIGVLSKLETEDGAIRSENTLRRMVQRCRACSQTEGATFYPEPNVIIFAQVLSAWAKSGSTHAGQRAEAILRWMEDDNIPANAVCYNTVIDAWSRSPDEDAAERAELLLREMEHQREARYIDGDQQHAQDNNMNPTTVTYTSVITAWARSNRSDAAERAEAVLSDMIYAHNRMRDRSIRPNKLTYGAILAAWAASDHPKAADRAEDILEELIDRYSQGDGDEGCRPNEVMFNSVLHALSNSGHEDATGRARELLDRMWKLYDKCGHWDVRPTTTTYNSLLNCLAKSKRMGLSREALELLGQMEKDSSIPEPDIYSYVSVLDALAAEKSADAAKKAHAVVARAEDSYHRSSDRKLKPNILLYTALVRAVDASGEVESKSLQSIEYRVRRAGIRMDSVFSWAVESALEKCKRFRA